MTAGYCRKDMAHFTNMDFPLLILNVSPTPPIHLYPNGFGGTRIEFLLQGMQ